MPNDRPEVHHFRLEDRPSSERQKLASQPGGPIRGLLDLFEVFAGSFARRQFGQSEAGVAANRGQQVVEVVGDPARESSDLLHLLSLAQLIFQGESVCLGLAPLADVTGQGQDGLVTVEVHDCRAYLNRHDGSVSPDVSSLEECPAGPHQFCFALRSEGGKVRRANVGGRHLQQLVTVVAELRAGRAIDLDEPATDFADEDCLIGEVEERPEALLRLP